jgi:hypothetical protein
MGAKAPDISGQVFGIWKVLTRSTRIREGAVFWLCECTVCGAKNDITGSTLKSRPATKCKHIRK